MDSSSDSDQTNTDTSEIVPDAKERFYSEKTPPNKSAVLEAETPSSEETVISEMASDLTTNVSETSSSVQSLLMENRANSFENKSKVDNIGVSESNALQSIGDNKLQINMTSTTNIADLEKCLDATVESYISLQRSLFETDGKCDCENTNLEEAVSSNDSQEFHDCRCSFEDNNEKLSVEVDEPRQCDIKEECVIQDTVETSSNTSSTIGDKDTETSNTSSKIDDKDTETTNTSSKIGDKDRETPNTSSKIDDKDMETSCNTSSKKDDKDVSTQSSVTEGEKGAHLVISSDEESNKSSVIELMSSDDDVEEVVMTRQHDKQIYDNPIETSFLQTSSSCHFQNNEYLARVSSEANIELNRNAEGGINISVITPQLAGEFPDYQPTCYIDTHFANVSHFNISQCSDVQMFSNPHTTASDNGNRISSLIRKQSKGASRNPIELDCEAASPDPAAKTFPLDKIYSASLNKINLIDEYENIGNIESTDSSPDSNIKILIDLMDDGQSEGTSNCEVIDAESKSIAEEDDSSANNKGDEKENSSTSDELENISILIDIIDKGDDVSTSNEQSLSPNNKCEYVDKPSSLSDNVKDSEKNDVEVESDSLAADVDNESLVLESRSLVVELDSESSLHPMEINCPSNQLTVEEKEDNDSDTQINVGFEKSNEMEPDVHQQASIGPDSESFLHPVEINCPSNQLTVEEKEDNASDTKINVGFEKSNEIEQDVHQQVFIGPELPKNSSKGRRKRKKKKTYNVHSMAMYINDLMHSSPKKRACTGDLENKCTANSTSNINLVESDNNEMRTDVRDEVNIIDRLPETSYVDAPFTQITEKYVSNDLLENNMEGHNISAAIPKSNLNLAGKDDNETRTNLKEVISTLDKLPGETSHMDTHMQIVEKHVSNDCESAPVVPEAENNLEKCSTSAGHSGVEIASNDMEQNPEGNVEPRECFEKSCEYNLSEQPKQVGASLQEFQSKRENHLRGCLWSPDGSSILTNSDDNILRLFKIPDNLLDSSLTDELYADMRMSEGETIYDMAWYPFMNSGDPDTCCFLSTSRDHPVHLWDASSGVVRCSYRAFNQLDELTSAHCASFNIDGSKIYCGFDKCVRIFDSARPGTDCEERSTVAKKNQSKKGKGRYQNTPTQPGIISSIAFSAYCGLYALGSFCRTVGLYSVNDGKCTGLLHGHDGGITQVKFTSDGYYLISGARKDSEIIWWDLRNTTMPLFKLLRNVTTNQRIQFDIDRYNMSVFSGGTDNMLNVWDLKCLPDEIQEEVVSYQPTLQFSAHEDAVNAVSLHPTKPLLASTSGQRHFFDDSDSDSSQTPSSIATTHFDNSLKIWHL